MKALIYIVILLLISVSSIGQELPKNFRQTIQKEYDEIKKDTYHLDFKLTFEQYFKMRSEENLADQKFYKKIKDSKSASDMCSNGDFEDGLVENEWFFYWYGSVYSTSYLNPPNPQTGYSMINTGSFSSTGDHSTEIHHHVESIGADQNFPSLSKVCPVPTGNVYSLVLGNMGFGIGKESIAKKVSINTSNYLLRFSYAFVTQNPTGHGNQLPYFAVFIRDASNTSVDYSSLVNLGNNSNTLSSNDPFLKPDDTTAPKRYKDWSCITADLSSLIGKEVIIEFLNRDCTPGAHWAYSYIDNICLECSGPSYIGTINLNQSQSDTCEIPGQICIDYTLPTGNNPALTVDLQLIQNGVVVTTLNSPTFTSNGSYCFQLNTTNTGPLNTSLSGFDYKIIGHPILNSFQLTDITIGSTYSGVKQGQNNDYLFDCSPTTDLCCQIPNFNATLSGTLDNLSLNLNSGSIQIQEVEVSMIDYHATYSEPGCQPVNMDATNGHIGYMNTTTNNLSTLNLVATQNNSHVLEWMPGSPAQLNHMVNFSVKPPSVINVSCCSVNFSFCIKVRVKDINCNVCEQILCYPSASECDCGKWNSRYMYIGKNPESPLSLRPVPVACGDSIAFDNPRTLNIGVSDYYCNPTSCQATYKWEVTGPISDNGSVKPFNFNFSQPGTYNVTVTPYCGNKRCEPCLITVLIKKPQQLCDCKGRGWSKDIPATIVLNNQGIGTVFCDGLFKIYNPGNYHVTAPIYLCNPANTPGNPTYTWSIYYNGTFLNSGSGNNFSYNYNQPGSYTIEFTPNCCGDICPPCKFEIRLEDSTQCDCTGKGWIKDKPAIIISNGQTIGSVYCGNSISIDYPGIYEVKAPPYLCNPANINPTYEWNIYLNGTLVISSSGNILSYNFSQQGNYTIEFIPNCCGDICTPCKFEIGIKNPSPSCDCGNWKDITVVIQSVADHSKINVKCGGNITLGNAGSYQLTAPDFICSPTICPASYKWEIWGPVTGDGTGKPFTFNFSAAGIYTVIITPYCGNQRCEPCKFEVIINKETECKCEKWTNSKVDIVWKNPRQQSGTIECNNERPFTIPEACYGQPITGNFGTFVCAPKGCQTKYYWIVKDPNISDNTIASGNNTTSNNFSFTPTVEGTYTLSITPICGSNRCDEKCVIKILIKNIKRCE